MPTTNEVMIVSPTRFTALAAVGLPWFDSRLSLHLAVLVEGDSCSHSRSVTTVGFAARAMVAEWDKHRDYSSEDLADFSVSFR